MVTTEITGSLLFYLYVGRIDFRNVGFLGRFTSEFSIYIRMTFISGYSAIQVQFFYLGFKVHVEKSNFHCPVHGRSRNNRSETLMNSIKVFLDILNTYTGLFKMYISI